MIKHYVIPGTTAYCKIEPNPPMTGGCGLWRDVQDRLSRIYVEVDYNCIDCAYWTNVDPGDPTDYHRLVQIIEEERAQL